MSSRYASLTQLLGESTVSRVRTAKILLVGAGGIGCELLKELVLAGFGEIHLVDLDTIDLSNLNRQFLFTKQHVKQSKAKVAAEVASQFNPDVHIVPYVANVITNPEFTHKWFSSFALVFNALDNAEARRHVNGMCVAANVPLIDGGSAGFAGQVQVIVPNQSECYDCRTHDVPKTYPVCTIRSTPSQPIHCVVWAKSFLFSLLFAASEPEASVNEENSDSETQREVETLNAEANELLDLRMSLHAEDFVPKLVQKVYVADIERLLLASPLWKVGPLPQPLQLDSNEFAPLDPTKLDDHQPWSVEQCMGVLKFAVKQLISRINHGETAIEFDKDDENTLDFVVAATGLRSSIFGIPLQSKFAIKQMAGNIIPAVATTNAIVAGLSVLEAFKLLGSADLRAQLRSVNILHHDNSILVGDKLHPPHPECVVSNAVRTTARVSPTKTLNELLTTVICDQLGYDEVSLMTDKLVYDPDFADQLEQSLAALGLMDRFVTVIDEDDRRVNLQLYLEPQSSESMEVDAVRVPLKPTVKRSRNDSDYEVEEV